MGLAIASETALSTAANTKGTDRISGAYQFIPFDALVTIYARGSATGMNVIMNVDGQAVIPDLALPWTGTAGNLSKADHEVASIPVSAGSRVECFLRNTTGGALTTDLLVVADPLEE